MKRRNDGRANGLMTFDEIRREMSTRGVKISRSGVEKVLQRAEEKIRRALIGMAQQGEVDVDSLFDRRRNRPAATRAGDRGPRRQ